MSVHGWWVQHRPSPVIAAAGIYTERLPILWGQDYYGPLMENAPLTIHGSRNCLSATPESGGLSTNLSPSQSKHEWKDCKRRMAPSLLTGDGRKQRASLASKVRNASLPMLDAGVA